MTSIWLPPSPDVGDVDPQETEEWLDAVAAVIRNDGPDRARQLLETVVAEARAVGVPVHVPVRHHHPARRRGAHIRRRGARAAAALAGAMERHRDGPARQPGRLRFRRKVDGHGLPSYPHPWLMPGFWQFPTVSMGLGPITAIYQARFMKYLGARGLADVGDRKVWAFVGDGEMDEPESLGALAFAARERLEAIFRGACWNVIKLIWGRRWDPLLAADADGRLLRRMTETLDGDYQTYTAREGPRPTACYFTQ
jgi:pyruvate dehydrogenase complex dehydrogenase (E1) component